ncbi:caspase family protein [Aliiruegeria sabulilitoris]|uniref:caspase family protein n=1 Tax=Aliiruegeria sabulilitoris TaxID=1510458 RepID=UPI0013D3D6DB|nr:caspase family protein [Aliiruegeria sabulilitoris]
MLIGVTDYDDAAIPDLRGPVNDVRLMRDVLDRRGVEAITVLASGLDGAEAPTRAAILAAFDAQAEAAHPGDFVYIHLSGHGSRQLDSEGEETDGLDEIFLPMDVARAPSGASQLPNAITDDEIGEKVAAIRARGADVFLVMDSCHSGSGMRAAEPSLAERQVDPGLLGIDLSAATALPAAERAAAPASDPAGTDVPGQGGYVAFYATRSNDVAREVDMSQGAEPDGSQWYGLFTAALAARLESEQALTYRQLFQSALAELNRGAGFGMAAVQTPLWEGSLIDQPVFGGSGTAGPARYLVDGNQLAAGQVHGLQQGSLMALVADAADAPDAILGYAQIEAIEPRNATLRPVSEDCLPDSTALCPPVGSLPAAAGFAQLEAGPLDRVIHFSPLISLDTEAPLPEGDPLPARFAAALEAASARAGIPAESGGEVYSVQVLQRDGALWFGPAAQIDHAPAGLSFDLSGEDARLTELLVRILKAERLAETLDGLEGTASFVNPSPIRIEASRFASDIAALQPPGAPADPQNECRAALSGMREEGFRALDAAADLKQCDLLRFAATGNRDGQRDVNRIHIDAQYCVHVDYELVEGTQAPRALGDPMVMCSDCPGPVPYSAGHERLYMLVSEVRENAEALNLTGLVENCGAGLAGEGTRSAARDALAGLLGEAAARGATRGAMGLGGALSDVWVESYRWRVMPRASVFARAGLE